MLKSQTCDSVTYRVCPATIMMLDSFPSSECARFRRSLEIFGPIVVGPPGISEHAAGDFSGKYNTLTSSIIIAHGPQQYLSGYAIPTYWSILARRYLSGGSSVPEELLPQFEYVKSGIETAERLAVNRG